MPNAISIEKFFVTKNFVSAHTCFQRNPVLRSGVIVRTLKPEYCDTQATILVEIRGFITELFAKQPVECFSRGNEHLTLAYHCIMDGTRAIFANDGDDFSKKWLNTLLLFEAIPYRIDRNGFDTLIP
jgi:hypothetical protein